MTEEGWLSRLTAAIGGRRVRPPAPTGHAEHVPEVDPAETAPVADPDASSSTSAFITYTKADGEESSRVITFRRIEGHFGAPEIILAHCHTRNAHRRFRLDRITGMVCAATGEELDPMEHCIALHRHGALKIEDVVLTRMMRVVTFMARCDGEFHALEHSAMEDILGRYFRFFGGDDDAYGCALREAPRLAPSGDEFVTALKYLTRAPMARELCGFAIDSTATIIHADGRQASEELNWALEVSDLLRKKAGRV